MRTPTPLNRRQRCSSSARSPCQALSWAGDLTINGNGSTIGRSTNSGTPDFRIVRVSSDTVAFNGLSDRGDESGDVAIRDIGTTHAAMICKYDESLPHAVSLSQVRRRSKRGVSRQFGSAPGTHTPASCSAQPTITNLIAQPVRAR